MANPGVTCVSHRGVTWQGRAGPRDRYVHFLSLKLTFLRLKLTFLSLILTFLRLKLTFLRLKLTFLRPYVRAHH